MRGGSAAAAQHGAGSFEDPTEGEPTMTDARHDATDDAEKAVPGEDAPPSPPADQGTADAASAPAAQRRDDTGETTA